MRSAAIESVNHHAVGHAAAPRRPKARHLYFALIGERGEGRGAVDELARSSARSFLLERLDAAAQAGSDLPEDARRLAARLDADRERTGAEYRRYVDERKAGAPRRLFANRAHALYFLRAVAPTKLVDGAWLYGVLRRAGDVRLAPLVRTYLDELGNGTAAQNHVLLYRRLLAANGCDGWQQLGDDHFTQGAIQLALAHLGDEFLPEAIGFNLGYEQLPLHLPITAHELAELDVDPYYFTLHVTIDNASTGHARKALESVLDMLPGVADEGEFMRRVVRGMRLNDLGMGTIEAIESFHLERELLEVLAKKADVGAPLHSDRCRVGGQTVAAWLSRPDGLPRLLDQLQTSGWIRRGVDPAQSRFWRVLHDERAPMFGVFSPYESQLLHDWILDGADDAAASRRPGRPSPAAAGRPALRRHLAHLVPDADEPDADDPHCRELEAQLLRASGRSEAMSALRPYLSPANHSTPVGLLATRLYAGLFDGRL